jgi:hypothetical protein
VKENRNLNWKLHITIKSGEVGKNGRRNNIKAGFKVCTEQVDPCGESAATTLSPAEDRKSLASNCIQGHHVQPQSAVPCWKQRHWRRIPCFSHPQTPFSRDSKMLVARLMPNILEISRFLSEYTGMSVEEIHTLTFRDLNGWGTTQLLEPPVSKLSVQAVLLNGLYWLMINKNKEPRSKSHFIKASSIRKTTRRKRNYRWR